MKNKFFKNFFQLLCYCIGMLFIWILVLVVIFVGEGDKNLIFFILLNLSLITILFFLFGFYVMFQKVIIDENGIKILFFKRVVNQCSWTDVQSIEKFNYMNNSTYTIKLYNGKKIHLERRKAIKKALVYYSKKEIV